MPWFVAAELVPQHYRSTANGFSQLLNSFFVVTVNFATLPLFDLNGPLSILLLSTLPSLMLFVYLYRKLPETRDREIADIITALMREK